MMAEKKLSPTMKDAIEFARAGGGKMMRHPGGYWAPENEPRNSWNGLPRRYVGSSTVNALLTRGCVQTSKSRLNRKGVPFPIEVEIVEKQ